MVQWLGLSAFTATSLAQSLVGELRSHKLLSSPRKKKKKRKNTHKNPLTIVPGWNCSFPERTWGAPWGQDRLSFILAVLESPGLKKPPRSSRTEPRMDHPRVSCPPIMGLTLHLVATSSRTETSPMVTFVWAGIWAHSFYPSGLVLISGPPKKSLPFYPRAPQPLTYSINKELPYTQRHTSLFPLHLLLPPLREPLSSPFFYLNHYFAFQKYFYDICAYL